MFGGGTTRMEGRSTRSPSRLMRGKASPLCQPMRKPVPSLTTRGVPGATNVVSRRGDCVTAVSGPSANAASRKKIMLVVRNESASRQLDQRDLASDAEARGRTPVTGTAAHVEQRLTDAEQSGDDRLKPSDEKIERKELSAVRVTGKLQGAAEARGSLRDLRTMREQHAEGVARRARKRGAQVGLVRVAAGGIGDTPDDEAIAH